MYICKNKRDVYHLFTDWYYTWKIIINYVKNKILIEIIIFNHYIYIYFYAQRSLCRSRTSHFWTLHRHKKLYTLQKMPWSKGFTSSLRVFKYEILDRDMYSQVVWAVNMRYEWQQKRRETTMKVRQRTNMARMRKPLVRNQSNQAFLCTKAYLSTRWKFV